MAGAARAASLPQYGRPTVAEPCHSNVSSSQTAETSGLAARWEYVFRGSLDPRTSFPGTPRGLRGKRREARVCFPPRVCVSRPVSRTARRRGDIVPQEPGFCPFANEPDVFHTVSTVDPRCRKLPARGLIRADCSGAKDDRFLYPRREIQTRRRYCIFRYNLVIAFRLFCLFPTCLLLLVSIRR